MFASRRTAAVVADAVEAHRVPEVGVGRLDGEHDLAVEVVREGHVARGDAEAEHLAAAGAAPAEGLAQGAPPGSRRGGGRRSPT